MNKLIPHVLLLTLIAAAAAFGQTPTPSPDADGDVVKITSKLVQTDVIVVDKDGLQVTDLRAEDFELLQDGKPQQITGFAYVSRKRAISETPGAKNAPPGPPRKLTSGIPGRIITFIVDDGTCATSAVGMRASREGIEKFIRQQMEPTDMVAIYKTRSGSSVFQQYTNDKAELLRAASKINWRPPVGFCNNLDGSIFEAAKSNTYIKPGGGERTIESPADKRVREDREDRINNDQVVGTLGVVRYVVTGLQKVPGRKIVFFLSDGIPLRERSGKNMDVVQTLRSLTDLSNRASVVFNTIDVRGMLDPNMIEARDQVYVEGNFNATQQIVDERTRDVRNSQDGLHFLAAETGGRFYRDQNFIDKPIKQALSIETGYYLLSYEPSDDSFKSKKFNKIEVKVNRPGLRIVSRAGFLSIPTAPSAGKKKSEDSELYEAIVAPLPVAGLDVSLTAYFANSADAGNYVRSFFHLPGDELAFVDDANGMKKGVFDVVAVTLNEKNEVVDEFNRTHTIKLPAADLERIRSRGLVYSVDVPVKKSGTYNFRVAVRDANARRLGSAGQVVYIPDLKKTKLYLSGLNVAEADGNKRFAMPSRVSAEAPFAVPASASVAAIRKFRPGAIMAYSYTVYNPPLDNAAKEPKFTVQVNLYKDGVLLVEGKPQLADLHTQTDQTRVVDFGFIRLSPTAEPGDYAVQVIVNDPAAGKKDKGSSQWVDFVIE